MREFAGASAFPHRCPDCSCTWHVESEQDAPRPRTLQRCPMCGLKLTKHGNSVDEGSRRLFALRVLDQAGTPLPSTRMPFHLGQERGEHTQASRADVSRPANIRSGRGCFNLIQGIARGGGQQPGEINFVVQERKHRIHGSVLPRLAANTTTAR